MRPLPNAGAIAATACRLLAERLDGSRVQYSVVEGGPGEEVGHALGEHVRRGVGMPPRYPFAAFGEGVVSVMRAGRTLVIRDVDTDARIAPSERGAYRSVDCLSAITVSPVKSGRIAAALTVQHDKPRNWTDGEIITVEAVAERTWAAVERVRAEAALRESEDQLRAFGEASSDVLWIRDAKTLEWVYLSPAFESIYGLSREEALSGDTWRNWLDLVEPEDREHARAEIGRARAGERVTFEYRVRRPVDGQVRALRNTDFPIRDAEGQVARIGGVGHDATRERAVQRALEYSERRLRTLVEGIPQLVWRAVDHGHWTWASPQWTEFTGQPEVESHGWGWLEPLHPDDQDAARAAWEHSKATGLFDAEYRVREEATGEFRWFHTRATPVRDQHEAIVEWLGTSTDVQDLREMQERQGVLVAELQHRTKNLMAVVRGVMVRTRQQSENLASFVATLDDRLRALARVQGLLSRLKDNGRVTFDELIRTELSAVGAIDAEGRGERVTLDGRKGIRLPSSPLQTFALAIHELATNAVKYGALGQPDGHLTVRWRLRHEGEEPRLHVTWIETGVAMPDPDAAPQGGGFGRELIERALPYQLGAETTYVLAPDGVRCTIVLPVSSTMERDDA
ncbi:PAS domain S-box protein [Rubellimicrobium roseum]|uniref:histidine kinase n=2 Tax=Rubellimicrobium roseum TaxID=687525 RepID=A0A5C4NCC4_9RHOB|nr:PAS domain S-box protein [Rubellimicrobium roseum]